MSPLIIHTNQRVNECIYAERWSASKQKKKNSGCINEMHMRMHFDCNAQVDDKMRLCVRVHYHRAVVQVQSPITHPFGLIFIYKNM